MKSTKCLGYVFCCGAALLLTLAPAQNPNSIQHAQPRRAELRRALSSFASWAKRYAAKSGTIAGSRTVEEGIALAKQRRAAIRELIRSDPALVLEGSLPGDLRQALPREITDELEIPIYGTGDLLVACAIPAKGSGEVEVIQRHARLDGRTYRAYVYGRRLTETTKFKIPLHGVLMDGVLALDERVLSELDAAAAGPATEPVIDLSNGAGQFVGVGPARFARLGKTVYRFASSEHLQHCEGLLETAEADAPAEPIEPASILLERGSLRAPAQKDTNRPLAVPSGQKKILVIRTDFSDRPGDPRWPNSGPLTAEVVQGLAESQVSTFYQNSSYGKAHLAFTVTPTLYRLPRTAADYATVYTYYDLYNDAQTAARGDYVMTDYDVVVVLFSWLVDLPGSQIQFGGLNILGTGFVCVNGEFDFRVVAHELGHTYGLYHANVWKTSDGNPLSDFGSSSEYSDLFDTMGANFGDDRRTDFNPWFKYMLNWIPEDEVQTVTTNGLYRVYRFDDAAATGTLALRIMKDWERTYWIGCRRNFTENSTMEHGAYVLLGYNYPRQSNLLCLGENINDVRGAGLVPGGVLADSEANLIVTVVDEGGTDPNQYIDVQVTFAPPPMIVAQPQSQEVLEGQAAVFTVGAAGNPVPDYVWQRQAAGSATWTPLSDSVGYSGTGTPTLLVNSATLSMNGDALRCLLTNSAGGYNISWPVALIVERFGWATLAGQSGIAGQADGIGRLAQFNAPTGIAVDFAGNAYVADSGNHVVRKISPTGVVTTLAGATGNPGGNDGVGSQARFDFPTGIAVDANGIVYVADQRNSTIRKITPEGGVTTLAGLAGSPGADDGVGTAARFALPNSVALDCFGNLFVADTGNHTVREVTPQGMVSTVAGLAGQAGFADGEGLNARFNHPSAVAVDVTGNLYIADQQNSVIRKINAAGQVTTLAGSAGVTGNADGIGSNARFNFPAGIAVDAGGIVYVADGTNSIRTITADGMVSTLEATAINQTLNNVPSSTSIFTYASGVAVDSQGTLYVVAGSAIQMTRSGSAPAPVLRMSLVADQLILSWPASANNYTLETRNSLSEASAWTAVTAEPTVVGCNLVLTNELRAPAAFYRLHRP